MAKKPTPPPATISIELPQAGFSTVMYFNRFGVEEMGEHKLVHFGLLRVNGDVIAASCCVFESALLEQSKTDWLNYVADFGLPEEEPELGWRCPPEKVSSAPITNMVFHSRTGTIAEIRCYCFSQGEAHRISQGGKPGKISAVPVNLLRCPADLQMTLIMAFYRNLV